MVASQTKSLVTIMFGKIKKKTYINSMSTYIHKKTQIH